MVLKASTRRHARGFFDARAFTPLSSQIDYMKEYKQYFGALRLGSLRLCVYISIKFV